MFLNERYVGTTPVRLVDLRPGRYRVLVGPGSAASRVHVVRVRAAGIELHVDVAFEAALAPYGLRFADGADRRRREAGYAVRLARALGASDVVTAGAGGRPERPLFIAARYDATSGECLRRAAVPLAAAPAAITALGRFLRTGDTTAGLILDPDRPAAEPPAAAPVLRTARHAARAHARARARACAAPAWPEDRRSRHRQSSLPTGHVALQVPAAHTSGAVQGWSHAPQLATSLVVLTQLVPHGVRPVGHAHAPAASHERLPWQVPQEPPHLRTPG